MTDGHLFKKRYGRTELQMPLVTMGGMRLQQTWVPDTTAAIAIDSMKSINKTCQENFVACIRRALKHGINHFETARFYGTSEMQYCDALASLIDSGEIKREDIIVQTKVPPNKTNREFRKAMEVGTPPRQSIEGALKPELARLRRRRHGGTANASGILTSSAFMASPRTSGMTGY